MIRNVKTFQDDSFDGYRLGALVASSSGRDSGKLYIINDFLKNDYVLLVDGKIKKTSRPKRKNVKHLLPMGEIFDIINGSTIENRDEKIANFIDTYIAYKNKEGRN